jgi:hypothetical protein
MYDFRACGRVFQEQPVLLTIGPLEIRWMGAMVDLGFEEWVGDLGNGGWGILEGCGWQEDLPADTPFFDASGVLHPAWERGIQEAANKLAENGRYSGPESDPSIWASWIVFEISEPRARVVERFGL